MKNMWMKAVRSVNKGSEMEHKTFSRFGMKYEVPSSFLKLIFRISLLINNIFLVIVFGRLFENLQLLSQLKLREMVAGSFQ
jgi:hypothetical protein